MSTKQVKSDYWSQERADVLHRFSVELEGVTGDGSKKRQAGEKPAWYEDDSHEGAVFSHITKWKRGELVDPDSGRHPLVHAAWRLLAIACIESGNVPKSTETALPSRLRVENSQDSCIYCDPICPCGT
jgi:hypothetical protein